MSDLLPTCPDATMKAGILATRRGKPRNKPISCAASLCGIRWASWVGEDWPMTKTAGESQGSDREAGWADAIWPWT
jgi:hypothetical protein